jgi:LysM repeat protein
MTGRHFLYFMIILLIVAGAIGYSLYRQGFILQPGQPKVVPTSSPESSAPVITSETKSPTFDIVRIDPTGRAVIAGRAEPGSVVQVYANGAKIGSETADGRGEWVVVITEPLNAGVTEVTLEMSLPDGQILRSEQTVIVAVPESGEEPLVVLGRPGGPSKVLQGLGVDVDLPFALIAVDYDEQGAVIFSGRAEPRSVVRIHALQGQFRDLLGETRADEAGSWSLTSTRTLAPGIYNLQLDQLDGSGLVTAVLAIPFERASSQALAAAGERSVVVQPGNSLWRIARRVYGSGWQYTVIYQANDDQIRDPDLIYPGQILDLPKDDEPDVNPDGNH